VAEEVNLHDIGFQEGYFFLATLAGSASPGLWQFARDPQIGCPRPFSGAFSRGGNQSKRRLLSQIVTTSAEETGARSKKKSTSSSGVRNEPDNKRHPGLPPFGCVYP